MRHASAAIAWCLLCCAAAPLRAAESIPVSARARLNLEMMTTRDSAPWPWDVQSRSPLDGSRFMTDLTAGREAYGVLYLKGAANWQDTDDAAGRVAFVLEQGDYLYQRSLDRGALSLVVFGDERRYFSGELGTVTMDDDAVARFQHRFGATLAASHGAASADYRISSLENGPAADLMQRGAVRWSARAVHAAVSYQHIRPDAGREQAVFQAEAASYYRRFTAVVSYAQSGRGGGFFFPDNTNLPGDIGVGGFADAAPDNAAASAEARMRSLALGDVRVDAVYRYQLTGAAYVDELAGSRPGCVANVAELYASHRQYAIDGRLTWRDEKRFVIEDAHRRALEGTVRAFLQDNSQLLLRAAAERREYAGSETYDAGLVQAGYRRDLQRFMGGVHVMLDGIGEDAHPVGAAEARINWSATSALYARWIVNGEPGRPDAVYARLEFRPTGRTWVTAAYGWALSGDSPYIFDDRDGLPSPEARDAFTVTVRGDF